MLACETFPLLAGGKSLLAIGYTVATTSLVVQNLRSFLIGQGVWNGTDAIDLTFTIPPGTSVWSDNKAYAAIEVLEADFPEESVIRLANAGLICGKGDWSPAGGAIKATRPIIVDNTGEISGGGANASGGGGYWCNGYGTCGGSDYRYFGGCYGSCMSGAGAMGYGYGASSAGSPRTIGANGACCGGGVTDCGGSSGSCTCCGGGAGGVGGLAGSGGYSISGNSFITWVATGTRNGSIS